MMQNIDVFISHHTSSCLPVTQAICNNLESSGIRCWYAPRDTADAYAGSIVSAINKCSVFVLVLNHESSVSQDVLNEINLAVERIRKGENLSILPFQISADSIGDDAKYYIGRIHWIDAVTPPIEQRIEELKMRITSILNKGSSPRQPVQPNVSASVLKSSSILPNANFVGRTAELSEIGNLMTEYNKLFLQGMGGIGKSELAKTYALKNRDKYNTVIFATYQTTLQDMLVYDPSFRIDELSRICDNDGKLENDEAYFDRKLQWLKENANERTLLIIDNFDTEYDEHLESFLNGAYAVIMTTRNDFEELGLPVLHLTEMDAETEQLELFTHYYRRALTPQAMQTVRQILELVNGHTLAIELISKFMFHGRIQPDKMLAMLSADGINAMSAGAVSRGFGKAQSAYDNIRQLFNLYELTESERYVMTNLSLAPLDGIDFVTFGDLCELEDFFVVDELIRKSWIRHNINEDTISLHPLIRDVVRNECTPTLTSCIVMIRNLTDKLKQLWGLPLEDKLRFGLLGKSVYEKLPNFDVEFADTYMAIGSGLTMLEQYDLSREVNERCLDVYLASCGEISEKTARAYYQIGDNELHRNNYILAVEYLTRAITILEVAAPNTEQLAYMIKFLCWTRLGWMDDHEETERLLHISNKILSEQEPINLSQMASQHSAYATLYYLMGQQEKALAYADDAYKVFNSLHGEIHGDTLAPMGIKARILSKLGRAEEAVRLIEHVIDIQIQLNGDGHQKVLNRYESMAEIYENIGDTKNAQDILKKVLSILEERRDSTSPFYRRIKSKLDK